VKRRRHARRRRGSVSIETLIVIGLVFIPVWGVMEYLHESALSKGALRQQVRHQTLSFAARPDCEAAARSCARAPLGVALRGPAGDVGRWVDADPREIHYAACAGSTRIDNPRAGVENRGHANVYTCQEPVFRQPDVGVEDVVCGRGGVGRGTDLCD